MNDWKPSEKCYKCEDLMVTFKDKELRFSCNRLEKAELVVPYLLAVLWEKHKDEVASEKPECQEVAPPRAIPQAPQEARAWRIKRPREPVDCPDCEISMQPIDGKYMEFTYTMYQLYRCKCGYEIYVLVSRIPRSRKTA